MRKAGALTALIAASLGLVYAILTLTLGDLVGTPEPDRPEETVRWLGWGGILLSLVVVVLSGLSFRNGSRIAAALVIVIAAVGAVFGSGPFLVFMWVSVAGGVLALLGDKQRPLPEA